MCKTMKIELYGASDGFHIDDPDWDFKVRMKSMFLSDSWSTESCLRGRSPSDWKMNLRPNMLVILVALTRGMLSVR